MRDIHQYEKTYATSSGFEAHMVRFRRRKILELLAAMPHRGVLEVGCGLDSLAFHLEGWERFVICEPAPSFAEEARRRGAGRPGLEVVEGFLEERLEVLRQKPWDVIVASSILHEVEDPVTFLSGIAALCTPQTLVHINVPNARSLHILVGVAMGIIPSPHAQSELARLFQRTSTFDMTTLTALVEQAGFRVVSRGSCFLKPFTHAQMQQMLAQGIISDKVLDALDEVGAKYLPEFGAEIYVNALMR